MNIESVVELGCKHQKLLLQKLQDNFNAEGSGLEQAPKNAQFVFCMDRRLERVRRALEEHRGFETFGLPGNFSLPAEYLDHVAAPQHGTFVYNVSLNEKCAYAKQFLRALDLHDEHDFAPLIIVCGHESSPDGSAFPKGLQCAASHDLSGKFAARSIVELLNDGAVRAQLRREGFVIGHSTHFLAAIYNTKALEWRLDNKEQALPLEIDEAIAHAMRRVRTQLQVISLDEGVVSEPILIIAPRQLSKNINFENHVFLYSYRAESDEDGDLIGGILPTVVPLVQGLVARSASKPGEEKQPLVVVLRAAKPHVERAVELDKELQRLVCVELVKLFVFDITSGLFCFIKCPCKS